MSGVAPVGNLADKQVESMRERQYAYLVEQEKDFSCGAAALATILRYGYEKNGATEARILEGLFSVADNEKARTHGFSLLDLKRFVEAIGMRGRGYHVEPEALGEIQVPTIVLVEIDGYRHFVVLRNAKDGRVYLGDPALGNRTMRLSEFAEAWNGIVFAVVGSGFNKRTALLDPRDEIPAPRLSEMYASIPQAQALGFGFRRAEIF